MASLKKPHEFKVVSGVRKLVRENFTVRFVNQGSPPVIIQGGTFFSDGGDELDVVPDWVMDQLKTLSSETRERLELKPSK